MSRVAVHMRIANLNVTNEEVVSRQQAVSALVANWKRLGNQNELAAKANEIAAALSGDGIPPAALGEEVEQAIQKSAPAYICGERPLDVGICAALAALALVAYGDEQSRTSAHDMFAAILWSALAYQPVLGDARREALRVELRDACRKRCVDAAESTREREDVEEFDETSSDAEEDAAEGILEVKRAAADAIGSLKRNAILDREELNFLWWAQLNRNRLLKKPLAVIPEPVRLVACAIEGAQYLNAFPAEVHRELVLRTLDADPKFNHEGLLKQIGADREALNGVFGEVEIVGRLPEAFPLLYSLRAGEASEAGATVVRSSSEWALRALHEGAIARLYLSESAES